MMQPTQMAPEQTEAFFMSQLILLLGSSPNGGCTLSQIATLVPESVKGYLESIGGLSAWLAKYPSLVTLVGDSVFLSFMRMQPSPVSFPQATCTPLAAPATQQSVTSGPMAATYHNYLSQQYCRSDNLAWSPQPAAAAQDKVPQSSLGANTLWLADLVNGDTSYTCEKQSAALTAMLPEFPFENFAPESYGQASPSNLAKPSQCDQQKTSAVTLRGLPFHATVDDVREFLGEFVQYLRDVDAIQIVCKGKRPSGLCQVHFASDEVVNEAVSQLHLKVMCIKGTKTATKERYIEAFSAAEWASTNKKKQSTTAGIAGQVNAVKVASSENMCDTKPSTIGTCNERVTSSQYETGIRHNPMQTSLEHATPSPSPSPPHQKTLNRQENEEYSGVSPERRLKRNSPMLWVHGLPTNATEQDVLTFFSLYDVVDCVAETIGAVHLLTESGDKLTALAIVETQSIEDAKRAQLALDGQTMNMKQITVEIRSELTSKTSVPSGRRRENAPDADAYKSPRTPEQSSRSLMALVSPWSGLTKENLFDANRDAGLKQASQPFCAPEADAASLPETPKQVLLPLRMPIGFEPLPQTPVEGWKFAETPERTWMTTPSAWGTPPLTPSLLETLHAPSHLEIDAAQLDG